VAGQFAGEHRQHREDVKVRPAAGQAWSSAPVQALEPTPCMLTQRADELDHFRPAHAQYVPKQITVIGWQ
jgi:hypothetical protein